jgi:hypothetical protein
LPGTTLKLILIIRMIGRKRSVVNTVLGANVIKNILRTQFTIVPNKFELWHVFNVCG